MSAVKNFYHDEICAFAESDDGQMQSAMADKALADYQQRCVDMAVNGLANSVCDVTTAWADHNTRDITEDQYENINDAYKGLGVLIRAIQRSKGL